MNKVSHFVMLMSVSLLLLFIDFFTKAYVYYLLPVMNYKNIYPYGGLGIFQNVLGIDFSICLTINRGAAWGLLADFQIFLLIIRMLVIVGMIFYLGFINKDKRAIAPLFLLIAGAIGNVIDYFLYGFVIDFFQFNLWGYHFPVFNVADIAITTGVVWLFLVACFHKRILTKS